MEVELSPGALLGERYEIVRTLGRGGFAITYLALDTLANREVALKELFPPGSIRSEAGVRLPDGTERAAYQFIREARTLARLRIDGVVNVLDAFQESGTAFVAMEYCSEAIPLEKVLRGGGPMPSNRVRDIIGRVCLSLQEVHERGFLHRDIKPSNILLLPDDMPLLIDFGAAREWQADATVQHTTLFTPGYAPIEQLSEKSKRGPASDVYSVAATAYEMLVGSPPISAIDRISGTPLAPLPDDVDPMLATAIDKGLAMRAADRPQSAHGLRALIVATSPTHAVIERSQLHVMDAALAQLNSLRIRKNECPACSELLVEPKPIRSGNCPNCRTGRMRRRNLETNKCAICRSGFLREFANVPLHYCPICKTSALARPRMLSKAAIVCTSCRAEFRNLGKRGLVLEKFGSRPSMLCEVGDSGDEEFWLRISGRAERCAECEGCGAQFDLEDDVMSLVSHREDPFDIARTHRKLHRDEWARLAAKLPVDAGNFVCDSCEADYYIDSESATLVDTPGDPFGFAAQHQGRRMLLESLQWAGAGKSSGCAGLVCESCLTDFDFDGDYLRLRQSDNPKLLMHVDEAKTFEDWHRAARELPLIADEATFREAFLRVLTDSILDGEISWRDDGVRFASRAHLLEGDRDVAGGDLLIDGSHLDFSSRRVEISAPFDVIVDVSSSDDLLTVSLSGERMPTVIRVVPADLEIELESGRYEVTLTAQDAAIALANGLETLRTARDKEARFV